jgi:hypothetical protein
MLTDAGLGPFGEVRGEVSGEVTLVNVGGEEGGEDFVDFSGRWKRERALSPREVRGFSALVESVSFVLSLDLSGVDFFTANAMGNSTMNHCCQLHQGEEYHR